MSLDDIPQGSFICCYIGLIVTDDTADKRGLHSGDNYMAELDYIGMYMPLLLNLFDSLLEVLERIKEGCESETNSIFNESTLLVNLVSFLLSMPSSILTVLLNPMKMVNYLFLVTHYLQVQMTTKTFI